MPTRKPSLRFISYAVIALMLLAFAGPAQAYFAPGNGQAARRVLGQPNFTGHAAATTRTGMRQPAGVAADPLSHKVFVADTDNNRVLRFASINALSNGAAAEAVLGQPGFTTKAFATTPNGMHFPYGLFVDAAGHLWVADTNNCRVLRFDNASALPSGANASGVLGSPNFAGLNCSTTPNGMYTPHGLFVDVAGRLWVADTGNRRLLRFEHAAGKPNGANADGVLGQPNFTSSISITSQNGMTEPTGVTGDAAGRVWVVDFISHRVTRFDNAAAKPNGGNADGVLGHEDFTNPGNGSGPGGVEYPQGLGMDNASGRLFVADTGHHRILIFDAAAGLANGAWASFALGQPDLYTVDLNSGGLSAASLYEPFAVSYDQGSNMLLVADRYNNRVLVYGSPTRSLAFTSAGSDDGWVLENTETGKMGGSMSAAGGLRLGDDAANRQYRSFLSFDTSTLPDTAAIHKLTLKLKKGAAIGTDPFAAFGGLVADIKLGSFGATSLEIADFQTAASANGGAYFKAIASQPGWYQVVLPPADFPFVNPNGVTQFRLRFNLDDNNNHVADYDTFFSGDATASTDRPVLSIEYTLP